jgi:hypothetical protein
VTFGATDFWVHLEDHSINPLASVSKARPAAIAYDCGATEGINIVKAAGRYRTLKRFIISYLRGTTEKSDGEMIEVYHFDAKFEMIKSVTEILTEGSDLYGMTSMLIAGPYMNDWGKYMRRNSDGCWKFLASIGGNINLPWIHSSDIGKSSLVPLANDAKGHRCIRRCPLLRTFSANHPRRLSESLSFNEICELIKKVTGANWSTTVQRCRPGKHLPTH